MKPGDSRAVAGLSVRRRAEVKRSPPPGKTDAVVVMVHHDSRDILCLDLHKRLLLHWI